MHMMTCERKGDVQALHNISMSMLEIGLVLTWEFMSERKVFPSRVT